MGAAGPLGPSQPMLLPTPLIFWLAFRLWGGGALSLEHF